jgi:predicted nucleotidyltransferase
MTEAKENRVSEIRTAGSLGPPLPKEPRAIEKHGPESDTERLGRVLGLAVAALEEEQIPYVLIGGVASSGLGRPRATQDIDVFVKPQDASRTLRALAARGFETEETDRRWIYKGFRENVQVDIIFHTVGGIYLDQTMLDRSIEGMYLGQSVRYVPPEDLCIIKALVYDEATPRHWYDALGVLAATEIDWDYLVKRSQRARRRILSLLLYAQSIDIEVPNRVIRNLFERIYNS